MNWKLLGCIIAVSLSVTAAFAEDALDELEHLQDSDATTSTPAQTNPSTPSTVTSPTAPAASATPPAPEAKPQETNDNYTAPTYTGATPATKINAADDKDLTTLGKLSPFEDIAVIQPRYLPTTARFEISPMVGMILNQAFFTNYILDLRAAYHFTEQYAVELNSFFLSTSSRAVTDDLLGTFHIATSNIVNSKSFYGADFKWTPIYGKMGFMNHKIVNFDMYFSGGAGIMQTTAASGGSPMAFHVGTGQLFAISKSVAARWDLSWYFYNVTGGSFNDMHLTIGASFFVPGAKSR